MRDGRRGGRGLCMVEHGWDRPAPEAELCASNRQPRLSRSCNARCEAGSQPQVK